MTLTAPTPPQPSPALRRARILQPLAWLLSLLDRGDPGRAVPGRIAARGVWIAGALSVLLFVGLVLWALDQARGPGDRFDWMLVTGYATAVFGLWAARGQSARFEDAARRLGDRGALIATDADGEERELRGDDLDEVLSDVERRARLNAHRWGVVAAVGTAILFFVVYKWLASAETAITLAATGLATPIGYLVGRALGRLATFGFVRSPLLAAGRSVRADPGHLDGAAGLKPLGAFYFSQALLLLIPGLFLLAWTLLLRDPYWSSYYGHWVGIYQLLLGIVVLLQLTVFVAPMVTTHFAMRHQKRSELRTADGLGAEIRALRQRLAEKLTADDRTELQEQLEAVIERYRQVDAMPTWPVSRRIWHGFALQSVALATPIVTDLVKSLLDL